MSGAIGYIRVSTEDQALSVEAQRERITAWCQGHSLPLVAVYEDIGISGGAALDKRPGLMAALDSLGGGMVLVAVKRDRLARDTMTAAMIERLAEKAGAVVKTCDGAGDGDTPEAKLMRTMIDAFAEYERALIRARTKAALDRKKARGEKLGGNRPYGYRVRGGQLVEDEVEHRTVAFIRQQRSSGITLRGIVAALKGAGFKTRVGTDFTLTQVARLVERS